MKLNEITKAEFKHKLADTVMCDYDECEVVLPKSKMYQEEESMFQQGSKTWYACPACVDKLDDSSGYCSMSCIYGFGCDDSC